MSCNHKNVNNSELDNDSIVSDYDNSVFNDITDAIIHRDLLVSSYVSDSIFCKMSDETIANIYTVLKNKEHNGVITQHDITDEYLVNSNIYNNLPKKNISIDNRTAINDSIEKIQTSINQRDTIINGKKVKIKTITEYYE